MVAMGEPRRSCARRSPTCSLIDASSMRKRSNRAMRLRVRMALCCLRRHARASTGFGITQSRDECSSRKLNGCMVVIRVRCFEKEA